MKKILIVEDEFIEARNLERMLVKAGYEVCGIARSVEIAESSIQRIRPDFVLVDIYLKGSLTGIDLADHLNGQGLPFVFLSANSNAKTLERAKATRPYGFLVKPFRERDVLTMLDIAIYQHEDRQRVLTATHGTPKPTLARNGSSAGNPMSKIVGQSAELKQTAKYLQVVAPSDVTVLILGESGTGKELMAQAIHGISPRRDHPFIKVNCAAMPVSLIESILFGHEKGAFTGAVARHIGKFEQAQHGTLFLDEIGEIPPAVQVKLLRALQEREIERLGGKETIRINVRIVAATNRHLETELAAGRFRMDLYYRLNVFPLQLSPLRQRKTDIIPLAEHFIGRFCASEGKAPFALPPHIAGKLISYHWPGNIRELENTIRRLVLFYPDIENDFVDDLLFPTGANPAGNNGDTGDFALDGEEALKTWQEYEKYYILHVLKKCQGKISGESGAARALDIPPSTLESKMKRLGIRKEDYLPGK